MERKDEVGVWETFPRKGNSRFVWILVYAHLHAIV